jgi:hypothetical protein
MFDSLVYGFVRPGEPIRKKARVEAQDLAPLLAPFSRARVGMPIY